ncbi:anti-sigma factor family protein [Chloroflexota bacterium]
MNCEEVKGRLIDYLNGEIEPQDRADIDSHISKCDSCRVKLEALAGVTAEFRQVIADEAAGASPPDSLWNAIEQRLAKRRKRWIPGFSSIISGLASRGRRFWARPLWQRALVTAITVALITATLVVTEPFARLSPNVVVARATEAADDIHSYYVTAVSANKTTTETTNAFATSSGVIYTAYYQEGNKLYEERIIGNDRYYWEADTGVWLVEIDYSGPIHPGLNLTEYSDSVLTLEFIFNVEVLPDEIIAGVTCIHLKGNVSPKAYVLSNLRKQLESETDPDKIEELQSYIELQEEMAREMIASMDPSELGVREYWIGKDDYLLRQQRDIMDSSGEIYTTVNFSNFNGTFEMEVPPDATPSP